MNIMTKFFCFLSLACCMILNAAEYQNFQYEDAVALHGQNQYRTWFSVASDGEYSLYVDANNRSREDVELLIDGKQVPSLALPKVGSDAKTFRRLKLAANVPLKAGKHQISIVVNNKKATLKARALLVERQTFPHRWQLVWSDEFDDTADQLLADGEEPSLFLHLCGRTALGFNVTGCCRGCRF